MADVAEQSLRPAGGQIITPIGGVKLAIEADLSAGTDNAYTCQQFDGAGNQRTTTGGSPYTSLSAVSATGAGTVKDWGSCRSNWSVQTSGTAASFSADLQVSLDGVTWTNISVTHITVNGMVAYAAFPARYSRINLTAVSGGNVTALVGASG
jgi:hypothetical protein